MSIQVYEALRGWLCVPNSVGQLPSSVAGHIGALLASGVAEHDIRNTLHLLRQQLEEKVLPVDPSRDVYFRDLILGAIWELDRQLVQREREEPER